MENKSERRRRRLRDAVREKVRLIRVICKGLSSLKNFRVDESAVRFPREPLWKPRARATRAKPVCAAI
jgi:hypothetical protein